ncbi:hypothetical protein G9A89_004797 [Geosiphon pyriformis]|nr:hypothetical protein G9A89_004797 [Geosiphon pyriformis]
MNGPEKDETFRVAKTNSETKPWYITIDKKIYDIRDFVPDHPGGAVILTHIGKDATDAFSSFHPESAYEILANYYVKDVEPVNFSQEKNGFTNDLRAIKKQLILENYFESSKAYYAMKVLSNIMIWAMSIWILANHGNTLFGVTFAATIMGLFWQQCGWLSHDFLHHQVFEDRKYGNLMGAFLGGVCQGFSPSWWKDKHNTHHAAPNVHGQDPDIATHPLLTWSEYALTDMFDPEMSKKCPIPNEFPPGLARFMIKHQTLFYFPILCIARISWCIQSFLFVLPDGQKNKPSKARMPISSSEQVALAIHYTWYFGLIYMNIPNIKLAIVFFFASQSMCGLLLALVFALNHNGMQVLTEKESQEMDFFVEQVVTGRDVISSRPAFQWWIDWFCGGLNYQIEHHLFPSIPRHNYYKLQPIIENLCNKYKVPYHRTTFWEGTWEVFAKLGEVSAASKKLV